MARNIPDPLLARLSGFITGRMGLYFPPERWGDLERGVVAAAKKFGSRDPQSFIYGLLSSPPPRDQIELLASSLTVGESYFFRDKKAFEVLEEHILPEWVHTRRNQNRRLRIWSAGCASGEEAYSIAILLTRMIPDLKDWDISILATDINPRFLGKAVQGVYTEWSFRNVPAATKDAYFRKTREGRYRIFPHIGKMVTFSSHNLAEDNYPSLLNHTTGLDLIFCRNVIMYFAEEAQKKVIGNLYRCLAEGGWLVVSPVEASHTLFSEYVAAFPDAAVYRKDSSKVHRPVVSMNEEIPSPYENAGRPEGSGILDAPPEIGIAEPVRQPFEEALSDYGLGRYAEAEEKILEILSLNPQHPKAMELLSRVKANQGKLAEALELCEKVIAADRLSPGTHYLRANILQEQGRIEEAVTSLRKSIYLDPEFVLAHFALGNLLRRQGRQKESERHFGNALGLLQGRREDDLIAESEGISAGRLIEIIRSIAPEETRP